MGDFNHSVIVPILCFSLLTNSDLIHESCHIMSTSCVIVGSGVKMSKDWVSLKET